MLKLELNSFHKVQQLFSLLKLPEMDLELDNEFQNLMKIVGAKDRAGKKGKFALATKHWQKETDVINRIIDMLNARGILQKNILKIKINKIKISKIKLDSI